MPGLDFLYGALGAGDAITNLVAQRNFDAQQQKIAQAKQAQQDFENQLKATQTRAEAYKNLMEGQKAGGPAEDKAIPIETVDEQGQPITKYLPQSQVTGQTFKKYVAPKEPTAAIEAPKPYIDNVSGQTRMLTFDPHTGHLLDENQKTVGLNEVKPVPPTVDPALQELRQLEISDQQRRAAEAASKVDPAFEKSYTFQQGRLDQLRKPLADRAQKLGQLADTVYQNTPQADALIAPELLTAMAGGIGSGVRMNAAEIQRVVGGRSNWESIQAALNKWQTDPTQALSITPAQRMQIRALFKATSDRASQALDVVDKANQDLIDAKSPTEHKQIVANAQRQLTSLAMAPPAVPENVKTAMQSVGPGVHTLSDGSVWTKDADGTITKGGG
jgi:hypothetical protein